MTLEESKESLIDKAQEEENNYNWIEAVNLYEKAVNFYLNENLVEKTANCYKNLGYAHFRGADTIETVEDYLKQLKHAIKAYKEAVQLVQSNTDEYVGDVARITDGRLWEKSRETRTFEREFLNKYDKLSEENLWIFDQIYFYYHLL